jgi:hypothetical protein
MKKFDESDGKLDESDGKTRILKKISRRLMGISGFY